MSLEKRLRILPSGVVSKNDIGALIILVSILSWRVLEAKIPPMARAKVPNNTNRACENPRLAYTPKNKPLTKTH